MKLVAVAALAACGSHATYVSVRDEAAAPANAPPPAGTTVLALDGRFLALGPDGRPGAARWRLRPDLSYRPAHPTVAEGAFAHVDYFYLVAGHEADAEALAREHAQIDRDAGVGHAWTIYSAYDAPGGPLLVQIVRAESRAAYQRERAAAEALRGPRIRDLYARSSKIEREMVSREGYELDLVHYATTEHRLPGATGLVSLDYFAFDPTMRRLWVPASNTASVDVLDGPAIHRLDGFATAEIEVHGKRGRLGPTSVAIGDGLVYIGNRADRSICTIDATTLQRLGCQTIASEAEGWAGAPDGIIYVAPTKELWVTRGAPPLGIASADRAISIYDASVRDTLAAKGKIELRASAEGYAVDPGRGVFYTNLEETGETIAIDVATHAIRARWKSGCAEPHGLALDRGRGQLFVACDDTVIELDAAHDGHVLATIETGKGLDNVDFAEDEHLLYAAGEDAATLTIARVDADGRAHHLATVPTARGTRGVVAGPRGTIYVADPYGGRILAIAPRR